MLLASRRLTDDPRASFGAIAGVIMAVFVASAFFSFVAYADGQEFDRAGVIAADQVYVEMPYNEGPPFAEVPARIAAVPGVRSVLPIATAELMEIGPATAWVVPCVDLARQFGLPVGECGDGSVKVHSVGGDTPLGPGSYTIIPDRGERRPITLTVAAGDTAPLLTPDLRRQPAAATHHRAGGADRSEGAVADQVLRHDRRVRRRPVSGFGPRSSSRSPPRTSASPRRAGRPRGCSRSSGGSSGWA